MEIFDNKMHPDWDKETENFIHLNGDMEVPERLTNILVISYLLEFYNPKKDYRRKTFGTYTKKMIFRILKTVILLTLVKVYQKVFWKNQFALHQENQPHELLFF